MAHSYKDFFLKRTPTYFCDFLMEDITHHDVPDKLYVFTWNPSPRLFSDDLEYNEKWELMIRRVLKTFRRCSNHFMCIPEISDQGRLHCHGWFIIHDKIKWIKSILPLFKRQGFIKFNKCKSLKALKYSMKEIDETFGIMPMANVFCSYNAHDYLQSMKVNDLELNCDKLDIKSVDITSYFF